MRLYIFLSALLANFALQAQVVVWPGDANNNGIANHVDALYVGLGYGATGPARNAPSMTWTGYSATPWLTQTQGGIDYAHIDCDGDGVVGMGDFMSIDTNFNLVTGVTITGDTGTVVAGGSPNLSLNISQDSIVLNGVTSITMDISLGTPLFTIDSIYGLAFTIDFDTSIVDAVTWTLPGGFMGTGTAVQSIGHVDYQKGKIELALTRLNQMNATGAGSIGTIGIVMDDNIRTAGNYNLLFDISYAFAVTASENPVYVSTQSDSLEVITSRTEPELPQFKVYPNPFSDAFVLRGASQVQSLRLFDHCGRVVWSKNNIHNHQTRVEPGPLSPGVYLLEIQSHQGIVRKKLLAGSGLR